MNHAFYFFAAPLAIASAFLASPAHASFKCVDDKGVTHYGDTLPAACTKRAVTEISKGGTVVRKIDAPLTPEQIQAREELRAKQLILDRKIADQRTKDLSLMATFSKESDFDIAKARSESLLDERRTALESRLATLDKQLAKHEAETEFYQAGKSKNAKDREIPPRLIADIARTKAEQNSVVALIKKTEAEKLENAAKYDTDKQRWKRLKAGMKAGTLDESEPAAPAASPTSSAPAPKKPKTTTAKL